MSLNERIVDLCNKNNISQSKLEADLGIARGSVTKWKTAEPRQSTLQKGADYFNVSINYLLTGEEKEGGETYYLNDETREIAQEIFENPDLKSLFDMSRKMTPERLKAHIEFIKKMQDSEN